MKGCVAIPLTATMLLVGATPAQAKTIELTPRLHHLRVTAQREWSDFPARLEGARLSLRFRAEGNDDEWSLRLRQQDVKQTWKVGLNGKEQGRLHSDGAGRRRAILADCAAVQPSSPVVRRRVIGATGAVWLDAESGPAPGVRRALAP
jgi:hypothetical protein